MKFEQLLQVYWSKGFYFAGKMITFDLTIDELFNDLGGLNCKSKNLFIKRFEYGFYKYKGKNDFESEEDKNKSLANLNLDKKKIINMYLSQMTSVNHEVSDLFRYNLIRLYLIRSFKGKSQSIGKPSRGQRTWSNAQTAKKISTPLKFFISEMRKIHLKKKTVESKNKKILKKKIKVSNKSRVKKEKIKNNTWF